MGGGVDFHSFADRVFPSERNRGIFLEKFIGRWIVGGLVKVSVTHRDSFMRIVYGDPGAGPRCRLTLTVLEGGAGPRQAPRGGHRGGPQPRKDGAAAPTRNVRRGIPVPPPPI